MATPTVPVALAIMAHQHVRDANSASTAMAVFSSDLTRLLWTNTAGAHLLQLDEAGPQPADTPVNTAAIRQIRASGRMLKASGRAEALVRSQGGGMGRPVTAELKSIVDDGLIGDFVLVTVAGGTDETEAAVAASRRLLAETGQPLVAIRSSTGDLALEDASPLADEIPDPETVAAFHASGKAHQVIRRDDGGILCLARLASDRVLVWADTLPQRQAAETDVPPCGDASTIAATDRTPLPPPAPELLAVQDDDRSIQAGKSGMRALLQRWYFRNRDAEMSSLPLPTVEEAAGDIERGPEWPGKDSVTPMSETADATTDDDSEPPAKDARVAKRADAPAATGRDAPMPSPGPQQPYGARFPRASAPRPLRSRWDAQLPEWEVGSHDPVAEPSCRSADDVPDNEAVAEARAGEPPVTPSGIGSPRSDKATPAGAGDKAGAETVAATNDTTDEEQGSADAAFTPRLDVVATRFVWRIDSEGRFRSLSPEFAAAVGPRSADVVDCSFRDVAAAYDLDADGEIARLLDRRDTWSGRTLHWPVENTALRVPVDLAALPVYARDRSFDGFRGFGIARLADAVEDPDATGLKLGAVSKLAAGEALTDLSVDDAIAEARKIGGRAMLKRFSSEEPEVPFGRRDPAERPAPQAEKAVPKVIQLEERRRSKDGELSQDEEAAFRAIGQTLAHEETPNRLEQAIQTATRRIGELENARGNEQTSQAESDEESSTSKANPAFPAAKEPGDGVRHASPTPPNETGGSDSEEAGDADGRQPDSSGLLAELETVYANLPLPVLVQVREDLVYGNREFLDLTGYETIAALSDAGGLAHLFTDSKGAEADPDALSIQRATGEMIAVRTHMQRSTIAGRSCLVMSFFATPSIGAVTAQRDSAGIAEQDEAAADRELQTLRQEVDELKAAVDTAADGLILLDHAGNIRSMNSSAHRLFAIAEDDTAGRPFITLFAHESQKATNDYLENLKHGDLSTAPGEGREVIGRVAEGSFVPLLLHFGRLPGERGWYAVVRDISHRKRVEEELTGARREAEAASLQKSQFLANISHELRTPLNAIIGFADVMAAECFGPIGNERYLEYLDDIKRSGHHVLDLVNDLLDISKIEAGKLDLAFEAVSLNEVIADVVALMQPQANRERVIVRSNLPSTVPPVVADNRSIRQIAMNLVSNAIRFTPAGGQIIVSTSYSPDGDVALRFRDSGIGMSEREIEIAMMPFRQVNPSSRRRGEGTGLGLPLTKALVEANRAHFAISSTPGEGTLVEILFPPQRVLSD